MSLTLYCIGHLNIMAEFTPEPSCADPEDKNRLDIAAARQRIASLVSPLNAWQSCPIRDALDRVLHQDIISSIHVFSHGRLRYQQSRFSQGLE